MNFEISAIINGKRYDTATADHVKDLPCPYDGTDFKWENTVLYQSPKGQWFLAGEGNGSTRWKQQQGNGYVAGQGIILLTVGEAKVILETDEELYSLYFESVEG